MWFFHCSSLAPALHLGSVSLAAPLEFAFQVISVLFLVKRKLIACAASGSMGLVAWMEKVSGEQRALMNACGLTNVRLGSHSSSHQLPLLNK